MKWVDDRERTDLGASLARSVDRWFSRFERWVVAHPVTFAIAVMMLLAVWITVVAIDRSNAIESNPPGRCTAATRPNDSDMWVCIRFEGQ